MQELFKNLGTNWIRLCNAVIVGFTHRHLHQRVAEHKRSSSSIGKHFRDEHRLAPKDLSMNFSVLKKCTNMSSLTASFMKCFLLMNWDQVSMYSLIQFVLGFLNSSYTFLLLFNAPFFTLLTFCMHASIAFNAPPFLMAFILFTYFFPIVSLSLNIRLYIFFHNYLIMTEAQSEHR